MKCYWLVLVGTALLLFTAFTVFVPYGRNCRVPQWTTYTLYIGLLLLLVGLLFFFRSIKKSWLVAICVSIIITLFVGFIFFASAAGHANYGGGALSQNCGY
jgi:ATP/ADP translocase